ncbi:CAP domain-containing protein [Heyndrickxia sporothermodurans]
MIRFIILVACICLFIFSWPTIDKKLEKTEFHETIDLIESKIENFDIKPIIDKFQHVLNDFGIEKNEQLNNTVTAIQLISKNVEQQKKDYYTKPNQKLVLGFEYQLFDLTNSSRVNHHLPILSWDQHVQVTARNHSKDMAEHQFFDHTNLKGQSPFDRMSQDHIRFLLAGENIAYGQLSSIFAHEGLMNSLGHRKNILHRDYKYLGTGVAFNEESQPFYTQDFYAK